jgi:hypothetical protein
LGRHRQAGSNIGDAPERILGGNFVNATRPSPAFIRDLPPLRPVETQVRRHPDLRFRSVELNVLA